MNYWTGNYSSITSSSVLFAAEWQSSERCYLLTPSWCVMVATAAVTARNRKLVRDWVSAESITKLGSWMWALTSANNAFWPFNTIKPLLELRFFELLIELYKQWSTVFNFDSWKIFLLSQSYTNLVPLSLTLGVHLLIT